MRTSILSRLSLGPIWRLAHESIDVDTPTGIRTDCVTRPDEAKPQERDRASEISLRADLASNREALPVQQWGWGDLNRLVAECSRCGLASHRTQAVLGVGDQQADWLFVGEGPGAEEDLRGEPFVGQAGKLLDAMLASLGIARGNRVYIANAVKCRPPNNRTPEPDEIEACFPYLQRQIELIQPRVIVALGRPAAQALLKQEVRIGAARGQVFRFGETPVVVTYHPAYLLRNPADKGKAWADLCFAKKTLESSPPKAVVAG